VTHIQKGQLNTAAAEVYEEFFVPALFREWPPRVVDAAAVSRGDRVLDVACGTGVLARAVATRVGPAGSVTGVDINDGMLAVARRVAPTIDWRHGRAEALPVDRDSFDAVVSQFGLMFFEDRTAAVREMMRALRRGGRLAVAVWGPLDETPGYAAMTELLQRLFGDDAANALRAPYNLGDGDELRSLFAEAGVTDAEVVTVEGTARFPSIASWVHTDVKGWTLADMIDDGQFRMLRAEAEAELLTFVAPDGTVSFAAPAHIVTAVKA
jgi:SAM-dependent methyltransferase